MRALKVFLTVHFRGGDEIVEINETVVHSMTLNEVYTVLSQCQPGPVQVIISRHPDPKVGRVHLVSRRIATTSVCLFITTQRAPL